MAVIGTYGDIVFSVSRGQVKTFDGLKWSSSAKYATHDRHLRNTLLEFTGTDADDISFTMLFSAFLGVDPMGEITKLQNAQSKGKVARLIIGGRAYGKNKWVITSLSRDLYKFDRRGNLLAAKVSVSLKGYAGR